MVAGVHGRSECEKSAAKEVAEAKEADKDKDDGEDEDEKSGKERGGERGGERGRDESEGAATASSECQLKCSKEESHRTLRRGQAATIPSTSLTPTAGGFPWRSLHWAFVALFVVLLCGGLLPVSQQTKQKFCGKSLTEAMDLVCVNGYNDKISSSAPVALAMAEKREANDFSVSQVDETASYDLEPTFFLLNTYALSPFVAGMYANFLSNGRRRRRNGGGVYDECCRKTCSYAELAAYCRSPN